MSSAHISAEVVVKAWNVIEQTEAICIAAVQQNGWALEFVNQQTENICVAVIKQYGDALEIVKDVAMITFEYHIFECKNRKLYITKPENVYLFTIGCENNITKDEFVKRIHEDGGLKEKPHRQEYLDILKDY